MWVHLIAVVLRKELPSIHTNCHARLTSKKEIENAKVHHSQQVTNFMSLSHIVDGLVFRSSLFNLQIDGSSNCSAGQGCKFNPSWQSINSMVQEIVEMFLVKVTFII